ETHQRAALRTTVTFLSRSCTVLRGTPALRAASRTPRRSGCRSTNGVRLRITSLKWPPEVSQQPNGQQTLSRDWIPETFRTQPVEPSEKLRGCARVNHEPTLNSRYPIWNAERSEKQAYHPMAAKPRPCSRTIRRCNPPVPLGGQNLRVRHDEKHD